MENQTIWERFTTDTQSFSVYNSEHLIVIFVFLGLCLWSFFKFRDYFDEDTRFKIAMAVCITAGVFQLLKVFMRLYLGNFDHTEDLPLQLCNILPFFMWFTFYKRSKWWFGIFFFWIMAGTFQSMITPTLKDSFPHYESLRYWVVHAGLSYIALYGVFVIGWRLTWKDAIRSAIGMNVLALLMTPINLLLDSNYLYLIDKPPGKTLYDLLGPWPWYILSLEGVIVVLFGVLLIPFYVFREKKIT